MTPQPKVFSADLLSLLAREFGADLLVDEAANTTVATGMIL